MTGVGIAIIGTGAMGRAHARAWAAAGAGDRVDAVCSTRNPRPLPGAPRARLTTSVDEILADPDIGIISICTPTDTHRDLAIRALRAGKHVLLEKPVALDLADAVAISRAAQLSDTTLMIAHVVRFFGGYAAVADAVRGGAVGTALTVTAERLSPPAPPSPWWQDHGRSGGPLVDFAIHDFDQLNLHLGTPLTVRSAQGRPDGPIVTTVEYTDGGLGTVLTSMHQPAGFDFTSAIEVIGSTGLLSHRFSGALDASVGAPVVHGLGSASTVDDLVVDPVDPYRRQAEYFLACVDGHRAPERVTVDSAIAALAVSVAARTALSSGRTEPVIAPPRD